MITIEELIVESLYHRLVLVTIRRTPGPVAATDAENSAGENGSQATGEQAQQDDTVQPSGLGFLNLGTVTTRQSVGTESTDDQLELQSLSSESLALLQSVRASGEPIHVTRHVQTVVDTGGMQLIRTACCSTEVQTDFEPMWSLGSSTVGLQNSLDTVIPSSSSSMLPNNVLDMRNCDRFSIVHLEDIRNPAAQSFMMVQSGPAGTNLANSMGPGGDANDARRGSGGRRAFAEPIPVEVLAPAAMFVGDGGGHWKRELEVGDSAVPKVTDLMAHPHADVDSGIWDMVQSLGSGGSDESSGRGADVFRPVSEHSSSCEAGVSSTVVGDAVCEMQPNLQGVYRMFQMADQMLEAPVSTSDDVFVQNSNGGNSGTSKHCFGGLGDALGDALEPTAVVNFVVHRVEADAVRTVEANKVARSNGIDELRDRTNVSGGKVHPDEAKKSGHTSAAPGGRPSARATINGGNMEGGENQPPSSDVSCDESENPCMPGEDDAEHEASGRNGSAASKKVEKPRRKHKDIVRITSVRLGRTARRKPCTGKPRSGWKEVDYQTRKIRSADTSRCSSLLDINSDSHEVSTGDDGSDNSVARSTEVFPNQSPEHIAARASFPNFQTVPHSRRHHPGGGHPYSSSPYETLPAGRAGVPPNLSTGSLEWLADGPAPGCGYMPAMSGFDLFVEPDLADFEKFPDWMRDLPAVLHSVPISDICIPGSHIAVAIERDLRTDLDFSKCNYEMAEFLRKLPDLALFNNFRALMKTIWKSWMPKQCLSVYDQLLAGARYLDVRVTKLSGVLYGEHGLYARPLKNYLRDVRRFIEEHTSEVVIIHFQGSDYLDRTDKRHLVTALFQAFGAKMACSSNSASAPNVLPSLQQLWSGDKQVIIFFPSSDMELIRNHIFGGLVWSDELVHIAASPKTQTVAELASALDAAVAADNNAASTPSSSTTKPLKVVRAVLSPDMSMVFGRFEYRSMRELTTYDTSNAVSRWVDGQLRGLNVVVVDFVGIGDTVRRLLKLNADYAQRLSTS